MKNLIRHKNIFIQAFAFVCIALFRRNMALFICGICLCILPFISDKYAQKYSDLFQLLLNTLGRYIRYAMFTLLYILVIVPMGWIQKIASKEPTSVFIQNNRKFMKNDFENMW